MKPKKMRMDSLVGLLFSVFLVGCQTTLNQSASISTAALYWMQNAAEYRALTYQAYHLARERFDNAPLDKRRVVVMDLDETVLDNSAYAVWCLQQKVGYTDETWNRWVADAAATAVPGSIEFIQHVRNSSGTVVFISNRIASGTTATRTNLARLGVEGIDEKHLLLKQGESSKRARFQQVIKAEGEPILYIGDNLTDFGPEAASVKSMDNLQAFVRSHKADFGTRFIVLPNPVYGSWMPSRSEELQSGLKAWNGDSHRVIVGP
ncbi:5'-nucleotidase, lipoprotein e(P4) family [Xylophilus ampelinus]|uniref:5'-nucleotidase (Lipoprotein e(P4) family) n=1 Tax=Xylophilus ampelinus TaxID=54067 RepID=A0A318SHN2_9BURK|nr:5'-nucleotidase, lipoprotein e(P4) family [Xylophilus ampelinus]MCS4510444.1 5'-nucleotidase, lipoprotein e(P4) family [Xylophilus ampelinus]PYE77897.1 5'-nucleotidase (lipoprotein e(P4) family) [Xylophilus ampelinus]